MATHTKQRRSPWARHWERMTPSRLVVIPAPVRGVKGAPADATYLYAVDAGHRRRLSPLLVLPPVAVAKGESVFLVPGRSELGNELGYTLYRSAPNGDQTTLRAIAHLDHIKAEKGACSGYYRDNFALSSKSRVSVLSSSGI